MSLFKEDPNIETTLVAVDSELGTINTSLGTINTTLGTTNTDLGTINTSLGTINTSIGTTNTDLGTINTSLGTINTTLGTTNTDLGTINTSIGTSNTHLTSIDSKITAVDTGAVVIASSALPAGAATETTLAAVLAALGGEVSATWYVSTADENIVTVKSGAGTLKSFTVVNIANSDRYIWVVDDVTDSGTAGYMIPFKVSAHGGTFNMEFPTGKAFATGVTFASSSTRGTYTASGGNDFMYQIAYV